MKRILTLIFLFAILGAVLAAPWWIANNKNAQRRALAFINHADGWQIDVSEFKWSPVKGRIEAAGLEALSRDGGKKIKIQNIRVSYKLLGLLRGRLVIEDMEVVDASVELPQAEGAKEEKKRQLDIAKLILIKKIEIRNGRVENASVKSGGAAVSAGEIQFTVLPSILGDTKLKFNAAEFGVSDGEEEIISAGEAEINASTELSKWKREFPYINAVEGRLEGREIKSFGANISEFGADITYFNRAINLEDLVIRVGENALEGKLRADGAKDTIDFELNIGKPVRLPYIGRDLETVDTAGEFWGKVKFSGTGFSPREIKGLGTAELNYRFDVSPQTPVSLHCGFGVSGGAIMLKDAKVTAGDSSFALGGDVSIPGKKIKIEARGEKFPVEHVFNKFKNPHLNKIFGATDFDGAFEGWGKKFEARVKGTAFGGGWKLVTAEKTNVELSATYDELELNGVIFSGGKETGRANLAIQFGPKIKGKDRAKKINFEGSISNHPLGESLSEWGLLGAGTGEIKITGPHTALTGLAQGTIKNGSFHGIDFDRAAAKLEIIKHKLIFSGMEVTPPKSAKLVARGILEADVDPQKIWFHGEPADGLSIDAAHRFSDKRWIIKNISWANEESGEKKITLTGSVISKGEIALNIDGDLNLSDAAKLGFISAGAGPVDIDLAIRGMTTEPKPLGKVRLNGNTLVPKGEGIALEDLGGVMRIDASKIFFERVSAKVDEGEVKLSGHIDHKGFDPKTADLKLEANGMRWRSEDDGFDIEFDGNVSLKGQFPNPLLKGELTILDGKYTRDFTLIDAITGRKIAMAKSAKQLPVKIDPRFEIRARTSGDFAICNNVGDIFLGVDIGIKGTRQKPIVSGTIDALGGKVHYLGLEFEITKGFVEFRERYAEPYLEVYAQREVGAYNVNLEMRGPTNNLVLDLSANSPTGALDRRDAVSLVMFGVPESQRTGPAQQAGSQFTSSLVGQVVTGFVERPILKVTHLDIFRLEASDPGTSAISRIYVGKQLSDRLTFNFATDINSVETVQTLIGEYLVTDNLLFVGSRSSNANYTISGVLRFRIR